MSAIRKRNVAQIQSSYMNQYKQEEQVSSKRKKGLVRRLFVFAILAVILSYGVISTIVSQKEVMNEKVEEKEKLQQQLSKLKEEQVLLEEEIVKLNDDEYIAKIARRDYFLSEEGEIIFKIKDGSSSY